jgi:hypothetical protein
MSKYSFDLMILNDSDFRDKLHNAFASVHEDLTGGSLSADDHGATMDAIQEGVRSTYDLPEGDIGRIYKAWQDNKGSFSYIDKNPWDTNVKGSEDYGYNWLMGLSDEEIMDYATSNPKLRKRYNLTTPDVEFDKLIRGQHAAAKSAGNLKENTALSGGAWFPPMQTLNLDPETETAMNFVKGSAESSENIIDELRRSGLLEAEAEENLRKLAEEQAKAYNKNTASEALESLRYIDSKEELSSYYLLREQAESK